MEQNGLNKERLQLLWCSAAEGERFASQISAMKFTVDSISPEEIEKAKKTFEKALGGD
jgi:coenzyme F420-reducing hydrogenase delta subunit